MAVRTISGRDHTIRILSGWVMKRYGLPRQEAILRLLKLSPKARHALKWRVIKGKFGKSPQFSEPIVKPKRGRPRKVRPDREMP